MLRNVLAAIAAVIISGYITAVLPIFVARAMAPGKAQIVYRIQSDLGGFVDDFKTLYASLDKSGARVVVDGNCDSACTMVLGLVPRDRICATPRASFSFHAGYRANRSDGKAIKTDGHGRPISDPETTQDLMDAYSEPVRKWIAGKGGLTPDLIVLAGAEMFQIVRRCSNKEAK